MEELTFELEELGYRGRMVSVQHIHDLRERIEGSYQQGLLARDFYQERLTWFDFQLPKSLPEVKSLIIVVVPRPQSQAIFTQNGISRALTIPPTYVAYRQTTREMEKVLAKILGPEGYHVASVGLPLKLLAVQSGLGSYGRNNICYVPGMGSFLQLVAVYSDLPCPEDNWREPQMMATCQNCDACRQNCPTHAIPHDRFLLRAERCLVFHNERKGNIPFPTWIDSAWHNCLIGCLVCQKVCPLNRNLLQWVEGQVEFSEEETFLLLKGAKPDNLPTTTLKKLNQLDLIEDLDLLPRNLSVFFTKSEQ